MNSEYINSPNETKASNGLEVAIIGMAGRFPGAADIDEFWENLKKGSETITFFTDEELIEAGVSPDLLQDPNYVKARGILENFDGFDAAFFDYIPAEAFAMAPQMRLFHECVWTALENAGYMPEMYKGRIGLYAGASSSSHWETLIYLAVLSQEQEGETGIFSLPDMFSAKQLSNKDNINTRLSYKLHLTGPSYSVQTACSTSLVTVHMAVQGLINGECEIALAGGTAVNTMPRSGYFYQEGMIMSPDGHNRSFDARAKGTVAGDGVGAVVLKLLDNAREDGDHIYAVIKGTAVNNDGGRKVGYTAPSVEGQAEAISTAQYIAEVNPETVTYIEAHGTATELGDPVEIDALKMAFNTAKKGYCALGSVKSNVGHLDAAAGIAGFIKTVLALNYGLIPPSLHYETPNPKIDFENSPFYVNTKLKEWQCEGYPRRAGVSSFGIGGTNAHVVLEEYAKQQSETAFSKKETAVIMLLSARTPSALTKMTENLAAYLKKNLPANLPDVAYTLQVGRKAFEYREFITCSASTLHQTIAALTSPGTGKVQTARVEIKNRPLVFMFPGVGSEYINMGADLYRAIPVFRDEMNRCFKIIASLTGYNMNENQVNQNQVNDPQQIPLRLFAIEYALAKLLMKWGIQPTAMIGYSLGEYTAACIAGVLSPEDAFKLIIARTQLLQGLPAGMMLSVPLPREQLEPLLPTAGPGNRIGIAIDNGPSCVVAGPIGAMEDFEQQMKKERCLCMRVNTAQCIHSPVMDPILAEFERTVAQLPLKKPGIPYISNVTGQWISAGEAVSPVYWSRHLRETVRFADGIKKLLEIKNAIFIEVGPGHDLSTLIARYIENNPSIKTFNILRQAGQPMADDLFFINRLGYLWLCGVPVDWQEFHAHEKRQRVPLPTYPFESRRFPIDHHFLQMEKLLPGRFEKAGKAGSPAGAASPGSETAAEKNMPDIYSPRPGLSAEYVAPRDLLEQGLAEMWQRNFGLEKIGIHDNFFELGGDSLKGIMLINKYQKILDAKIEVATVFNCPTIAQLADYFTEHYPQSASRIRQGKKAHENTHVSIRPVEKENYYTLSSPQRRIYILQQMDPKSTAYNITLVVELVGRLQEEKLEETFKKLIARHESFRTSFFTLNDEVVQKVHTEVDFNVDIRSEVAKGNITNDFIRPFDLSCAPLLRVGLLKKSGEQYILMADMHHIISDGTSISILAGEFMDLYAGKAMNPLKIQYKDYVIWQSSDNEKERIKKQETWWLQEFSGEIPVLNLPLDYPRAALQSFAGSRKIFTAEAGELEVLKRIAREQGGTLYMLMLGIYSIFLYKLSGQQEVVIGSPVANRRHSDLDTVIGMFVNTLAIRTYPAGSMTFKEFLTGIIEKTLAAFENQEYPFEDLVEKVAINRDLSRNPLFDVSFLLQNIELPEIEIPGLKLKPYAYENNTAKFDLILQAFEIKAPGNGEILKFDLEYSTQLFNSETIERFTAYYKKILTAVTRDPGQKIAGIEIISEEERRQILDDFNAAAVEYPRDKTIRQLFAEQVEKSSDSIALVGADLRVCPNLSALPVQPVQPVQLVGLTYRCLSRQSDCLAGLLIQKSVITGDIVAIMMERSIDLIIGILGILKAGGAYLTIDPDYPQERIDYMLKDSGVRILINKSEIRNSKFENKNHNDLIVLNFENLNFEFVSNFEFRISNFNSSNLAYIMYTSGSTGQPKGVVVTHRNVVRLVKNTTFVSLNEETRILQTGAPVFDATTFEMWGSLLNGGQLVLVAKDDILNAHRLAALLTEQRINTLWLSSALFNQLIRQNSELFASLHYLLVGGDVLSPVHINQVRQKFPGLKVINGYGPTENTTFSTAYLIEKEFEHNIPIGRPIANSTAYIYDNNNRLLPIGVMGELYVGGDGLAQGYLNNPELTAEKFGPQITQINKSFAGVKGELFQKLPLVLYKTGDLARWLKDGNIEFLGRIDQQVKIRGFRIELGEIESRLQQHKSIKEAVVLLCGEGADKHLCAYIVPGDPSFPMAADLRHDLAAVLPDYMVPSFFVTIDKIPLTPNGKIDRRALPEPGAGSMVEQYIAPGDIVEEKLVEIWAEVLGLGKNSISITANFFEIGGHSLKATTLLFKIHKAFEVKLPLSEFFKNSTVRALAEYIKKNSNTGECYARIAAVEKKEYYALSAAPLRLYILQQMEPLCTAYNMTLLIELTGRLQIAKLEETFKTLIARHESLRTSFFTQNEQVVQKVHQGVDFKIEIQVEGEERADKIQHMIRPFDLSRAPLIRAGLIPLAKEKHILLVDIHHIISDAISHRVLVHDFIQLYTGVVPAPLKLHYKDYCEWWQQQTGKEAFSRQEAYWLKQFEAKPPVLDLNCDYPRPPVQSVEGRSLNFRIEKGWAEALKKYALEEGVTLQMIMKAIFHILLAKLGGQDDIITGTTIAGRRHADLEKIIGLFVNTLPIRTFPAAGKVFQHYLQEVREISLNAYENQDYPFDGLAKKIAGQRSGRNPIFDIMFEIQLAETGTGTPAKIEMAGLEVRSLPTETNTTKFEQDWLGLETPDGIEFSVTYAIKLYRPETIELMTERFLRLIDSVLANPMSKIADLDYRTPLEKELNQVQAVCFNF